MKRERKQDFFLKMPWYKGGVKALNSAIYSQLKYPELALKSKIEGVVRLKIEIDFQGKIVSSQLVQGIGFGCDEEAARIMKTLTFEVPKTPRKLRVLFHKDINVQFKLPVPAKKTITVPIPVPTNTQVNYQLVAAPKTNIEKEPVKISTSITYNYTVKI